MLKLKRILHPTDFSESAKGAFQLACSLARDHGAELVALHVLSTPLMSVSLAMRTKDSVFRGEIVKQFKDSHTFPGIHVSCHLADGDPAEEILHYAKEQHCDLIVMGTHGREGLWRTIMGSVAEEVSRSANCPVLTVRPPSERDTIQSRSQPQTERSSTEGTIRC